MARLNLRPLGLNSPKVKLGVGRKKLIAGAALLMLLGACFAAARFYLAANWQKASESFKKADYTEAAENLKVIKKMPLSSDPEKLRIYGQTMFAVGEYERAAGAYKKMYKITQDPFAKMMLGNIYNQQKDYEKAAETYEELISSNPNYVQVYVNLATVYRLQNRKDKAIQTAQGALEANPESVVLHELMISLTAENKQLPEYQHSLKYLKELDSENILLKQIDEGIL